MLGGFDPSLMFSNNGPFGRQAFSICQKALRRRIFLPIEFNAPISAKTSSSGLRRSARRTKSSIEVNGRLRRSRSITSAASARKPETYIRPRRMVLSVEPLSR